MPLPRGLFKGEVLEARWSDVDFDRGILRLPNTKAGDPRNAVISTEALALLREIPKTVHGREWVLPSDVKLGAPLHSEPRQAWKRVRTAAGCTDLRIYDLRHTTATWLGDEGRDLLDISRALGQSRIATTAGYVHPGDCRARAGLERLSERLNLKTKP
jgi:integrase